jgi:5'-methylthioadenosine phosphorylase
MNKKTLPTIKKAFIGGSSTYSINFPEDLKTKKVRILDKKTFSTPFGISPEFKIFYIDDEPIITVKMHGWRAGIKRSDASKQIFWVFQKIGVKKIIAEGGVGTIRTDLNLCDFFVPDDYIDLSMRKDVNLSDDYLLIMRDPICPHLSNILIKKAGELLPERQIVRGTYVVTDGRHFESKAEVKMIKSFGGDVIGQTLCPEVYLAREIGACYAGIYMIVNKAEGIKPYWKHNELKAIFFKESRNVGKIILESLKDIDSKKVCKCSTLRKKTLLT